MAAGEPHLLHIRSRILPLFAHLLRSFFLFLLDFCLHTLHFHFNPQPREEPRVLRIAVFVEIIGMDELPIVRAEFGAAFVEGEGVSKGLGDVVVNGEGKDAGDECAYGRHSVEDPDKVDFDGSAERSLVSGAD